LKLKPKTLTPLSEFTCPRQVREQFRSLSHVNLVDCPRFYAEKQGLFTAVGEKAASRFAALD
jgi:hypothetical protein